jgi:hypothetical protein
MNKPYQIGYVLQAQFLVAKQQNWPISHERKETT